MNSLPSRVVPTAVHDRRRCRTRCCKRYFINFPRSPILPGLPQYVSIRPAAPPPARGSPSPCLPRSRNCSQARSPSILLNSPQDSSPPSPSPAPVQQLPATRRPVFARHSCGTTISALQSRNPKKSSKLPHHTTSKPPAADVAAPAPPTMCTRVIHTYGCGHQVVEKAPCATSRSANCGVLNTKNVKHEEKCDNCDG